MTADERLRRSEERFRVLAENASEFVSISDRDGRISYVSPSVWSALGYEPAEMLGTRPGRILHPDDRKTLAKMMDTAKAMPGERLAFDNVRVRRMDGSYVIIQGFITNLLDHPAVQGFVFNASDVTDRRQTEQTLRQFGRLLNESHNEIYIFDPDTLCFLQVNQGAQDNLGYSIDDMRTMTPLDLKPEFSQESFLELVEPLRTGEKERIEFVTHHRRKNGSQYPVEVYLQLMDFEGLKSFVAIIVDITERKAAESRLWELEARVQRAQKLESIGLLAGGIAHDFNNILVPIFSCAEMLRDMLQENAEAREEVDTLFACATQARELVHQILAFCSTERHSFAPLMPNRVLKDTMGLIKAGLFGGVELVEDVQDNCSEILGDVTQLYQVILSLATNANYAMQVSGGTLEIGLEQVAVDSKLASAHPPLVAGEHVRLRIRDTGCGIEESAMGQIFQPLFTTKKPGEGTGLGLSVVQSIVREHDGAITVESEPGCGAKFDVYFPVFRSGSAAVPPVSEAPPIGSEQILLVDDERTVLLVVARVLESLGYEVTSASNAQEALGVFRADPAAFDLMITDQAMPGMQGTELVSLMKRERPDIPVILMSGYTVDVPQDEIREVLVKPVSRQELGLAIRRVLDTP